MVEHAAPRRRSRLTREARHEQLLDVAADLVSAGGLEHVTMESVAAAAGVSKGLGYVYFANRDELLVALFDREIGELDQRVAEAMAGADDLEGRVRAVLSAWFDTVALRGRLLGQLLQATVPEGALESRRRRRQRDVERAFAAMFERELGLPPRVGEAAAAVLVYGSYGALQLWLQRRAPRQELEDTFVRLAMGGLSALSPSLTRASS